MEKSTRFWIAAVSSVSVGILIWNASFADPDPPSILHRDPPEGTETKSIRHPPETAIIENITKEVRKAF
jgi:hypothetical protein